MRIDLNQLKLRVSMTYEGTREDCPPGHYGHEGDDVPTLRAFLEEVFENEGDPSEESHEFWHTGTTVEVKKEISGAWGDFIASEEITYQLEMKDGWETWTPVGEPRRNVAYALVDEWHKGEKS